MPPQTPCFRLWKLKREFKNGVFGQIQPLFLLGSGGNPWPTDENLSFIFSQQPQNLSMRRKIPLFNTLQL